MRRRRSPSSGPISSTARARPSLTATQTDPSPTASAIGIPAAGTPRVGATTSIVSGSILVSVLAFGSSTQTKPSPAAISDDLNPTGMSATRSPLDGSMTPTDIGPIPVSPSEPRRSTAATTTARTTTAAAAPTSARTCTGQREGVSAARAPRRGRVDSDDGSGSPSAARAAATSSPQLS